MKILFLRFSSIGDIVLTTPAVRAAKQQIPDAKIHFAVKSQYKSILQPNPYIDKIHTLNDSLSELIRELKNEGFDQVIDLHNNVRTLRIKKALGVASKSFNKLNKEKWLMVNFKINRLPDVHIVDRYIETLSGFGVKKDDKGLDFFIEPIDEIKESERDPHLGKGYYVMAIGAQHNTKILPVSKMIGICKEANLPVVLLGDQRDLERAKEIEKALNQSEGKIFNYCDKLTLGQSADYIRKSSGAFCHDSGLMHIAAAFHIPIISFWGNTIPEFGMYPYHTPHKTIENKNLGCRPCTKIGYSKCPKGHFKCMKELEIETDFKMD